MYCDKIVIEPDQLPVFSKQLLDTVRCDEFLLYNFFFFLFTYIDSEEELQANMDEILSNMDWVSHTYNDTTNTYYDTLMELIQSYEAFEAKVARPLAMLKHSYKYGVYISDVNLVNEGGLHVLHLTFDTDKFEDDREKFINATLQKRTLYYTTP